MDFDVFRQLFIFKSNNLFDLDIICNKVASFVTRLASNVLPSSLIDSNVSMRRKQPKSKKLGHAP